MNFYWVDVGFCVEAESADEAEQYVSKDLAANEKLAHWAQLTALSNYEVRGVEKVKE